MVCKPYVSSLEPLLIKYFDRIMRRLRVLLSAGMGGKKKVSGRSAPSRIVARTDAPRSAILFASKIQTTTDSNTRALPTNVERQVTVRKSFVVPRLKEDFKG